MKAYFESKRDFNENILIEDNVNRDYQMHFHSQMELFILCKGIFEISINQTKRQLPPYTVAIADSFDIHSYINYGDFVESCLIIIPYKYLADYNHIKHKQMLESNFVTDKLLCEKLISCAHALRKADNLLLKKAYINEIIGLILQKINLVPTSSTNDTEIIQKILRVVEKNFKQKITLESLSKRLGYSREHLSRIFRNYFHRSLPSYINEIRLNAVETLLSENDQLTITQAIYEAGFSGIQTYYRNLKQSKTIQKTQNKIDKKE